MREQCGCGASVQGWRKDVVVWRETHVHEGRPESTRTPDKSGAESHTQVAYGDGAIEDNFMRHQPPFFARIGFTPNGVGLLPPEYPDN